MRTRSVPGDDGVRIRSDCAFEDMIVVGIALHNVQPLRGRDLARGVVDEAFHFLQAVRVETELLT
jgi:hypothetical protein